MNIFKLYLYLKINILLIIYAFKYYQDQNEYDVSIL